MHDAVLVFVEPPEVERLKQHVAELGERDAVLALEAALDRIFGHHLVDRHVFANVAQEVDHTNGTGPVVVVHHLGGVDRAAIKVEETAQNGGDALDIVRQGFGVEQITFFGPAARIADHASTSANERDGLVARKLHTSKCHDRNQVSQVQRIGGWIESDIDRDHLIAESFGERLAFGGVLDQASSFELG